METYGGAEVTWALDMGELNWGLFRAELLMLTFILHSSTDSAVPIPVATVFARSNAGIVGSNPTQRIVVPQVINVYDFI
jgi:hypothetical protein